jgi:hypothetical protein
MLGYRLRNLSFLNRLVVDDLMHDVLMYTHHMRTTINLEPDIHAKLRSMAEFEGVTLGEAIARLVRAARPRRRKIEYEDGLPVLPRRPKGVVITTEMIKKLESETY